jgi:CubicO group peptidase (beta-lactamase class C family)
VKHLLTHTSGLTYGFFSNTPVDSIYLGANLLNTHWTIAQLADSLAKLPLLFAPGTGWHYGFSLDVLGRVIEVASGESFDRYLAESVTNPLAMTRTGFHQAPGTTLATVYGPKQGGGIAPAQSLCYDPSPEAKLLAGGSGILSTPGDYLRFLQMLLNGGTLDGHRVLKAETVRLMLSNELPTGVPGGRIPNESLAQGGYSQGFGGAVLVDSTASHMPGSPGIYCWWGYASTYFWIDPKQQLIGMLWSQLEPGSPLTPLEFQRLVYAALKH